MSQQWREVTLGDAKTRYQLHRSTRRTLEIAVLADGGIEVRAPHDLSVDRIEKRLRARSSWIRRRLLDRELSRPDLVPRTYQAGETHRYLGRQYRLSLLAGPRTAVRLVSGRLHVTVSNPGSAAAVRLALERWYLARAKEVLPVRLQSLLVLPAFHGLHPGAIRIQRMRQRWGSCSPTGRVVLNTDLIHLPVSLIDYVIVHELCHIRVAHHDERFVRLLARVMPEWRTRADRLARYRSD